MVGIRAANQRDRDGIRDVYLRAFPANEAAIVAGLAVNLLDTVANPDCLSLVAEIDGALAGHVAFSPVGIGPGAEPAAYILAPLAVLPAHQRHRVGTQLVESGIQYLAGKSVELLFVYGDPAYYGRFGFSAAAAAGYLPPFRLQHPFGWQAIALHDVAPASPAVVLRCTPALSNPALW